MRSTPAIPQDFRRFAHDGYTNVFSFLPDCTRLYATETMHGDWDAQVLLLAKDAAPTDAIRERAKAEGCGAWRHSQRCRGDRGGCQTNERLRTLGRACRALNSTGRPWPTCCTTTPVGAAPCPASIRAGSTRTWRTCFAG